MNNSLALITVIEMVALVNLSNPTLPENVTEVFRHTQIINSTADTISKVFLDSKSVIDEKFRNDDEDSGEEEVKVVPVSKSSHSEAARSNKLFLEDVEGGNEIAAELPKERPERAHGLTVAGFRQLQSKRKRLGKLMNQRLQSHTAHLKKKGAQLT